MKKFVLLSLIVALTMPILSTHAFAVPRPTTASKITPATPAGTIR